MVASNNYEKFITQTLQSLVDQTLKIRRIIVVDDGS
ncbi:glycosyltransferase family A protein [Parasutterella excrementihominis]